MDQGGKPLCAATGSTQIDFVADAKRPDTPVVELCNLLIVFCVQNHSELEPNHVWLKEIKTLRKAGA